MTSRPTPRFVPSLLYSFGSKTGFLSFSGCVAGGSHLRPPKVTCLSYVTSRLWLTSLSSNFKSWIGRRRLTLSGPCAPSWFCKPSERAVQGSEGHVVKLWGPRPTALGRCPETEKEVWLSGWAEIPGGESIASKGLSASQLPAFRSRTLLSRSLLFIIKGPKTVLHQDSCR